MRARGSGTERAASIGERTAMAGKGQPAPRPSPLAPAMEAPVPRWRLCSRLRSSALIACLALSACGAATAADPVEVAEPSLREGALTDFVPAAGLRWLIVGSPRYFAEQPALRAPLARLFSEERLDAFALATGVDLRRSERAALAAFELGELYLVDGSGWVGAPELRFTERSAGSARSERPHSRIWRVSALVSSRPQTLVRIDDDLLAVAVGDPTPARVVEAYALDKLRRTPSALHGAALATLPADVLRPAPLAAYALGPFHGEWATALGGVLGGALAFGATAELAGEALSARVVLSGAWSGEESARQLEEAWARLGASELGRLLALDRPLRAPRVSVSPELLQLEVTLDAPALLGGLHAAVAGGVDELLASPPRVP